MNEKDGLYFPKYAVRISYCTYETEIIELSEHGMELALGRLLRQTEKSDRGKADVLTPWKALHCENASAWALYTSASNSFSYTAHHRMHI